MNSDIAVMSTAILTSLKNDYFFLPQVIIAPHKHKYTAL